MLARDLPYFVESRPRAPLARLGSGTPDETVSERSEIAPIASTSMSETRDYLTWSSKSSYSHQGDTREASRTLTMSSHDSNFGVSDLL